MGISISGHLELIGIAAVGAFSQLCLKQGAEKRGAARYSVFLQPWTLLGVALMGATVLLVTLMLRQYPLTLVMPLTALTYVFVPLGAMWWFKEKQKPRFWIGAALIVTGIAVISF
jgi:drug/metabolite transporter (DMT)-like permease